MKLMNMGKKQLWAVPLALLLGAATLSGCVVPVGEEAAVEEREGVVVEREGEVGEREGVVGEREGVVVEGD